MCVCVCMYATVVKQPHKYPPLAELYLKRFCNNQYNKTKQNDF